ncbi:MAG: putative exported protein Endonuclease/Exonuclease/phosphatase domain, partial [Candidatus Hydrogenedentota bacterium]
MNIQRTLLSLLLISLSVIPLAHAATPVRVASYNIKQLSGNDERCFANVTGQGDRLSKLLSVIESLDADIIGMQEISDRDALELIFGTEDWTLVFDDEAVGCTNLALAVRKPLEVTGASNNALNAGPQHFLFESESDFAFPEQRDVLDVEVVLPNDEGTLRVFVHHGLSRSNGRADTNERRVAASQAMLTVFQGISANQRYVLVGDFNDTPDDACSNILEQGNSSAAAAIENDINTFMVNLMEPIFAGDNVTFGRDANNISGGFVNTVNSGIRQSNFDARNSNSNTGDNMLDNILVPVSVYQDAYVPGSANILKVAETTSGDSDTRASDHLPIYADFVFGAGSVARVFEEDFQDNADDPADNANDDFQQMTHISRASTGNNADWHLFTFQTNIFARVNGFGADTASDDWLFTPALDLTGVTDPVVTFRSAYNFDGPALELLVSTDFDPQTDTDPTTATWTPLSFTLPSAGNFAFADSGEVDLSGHVSASTYLAWRYTSTGTGSGQSRVWELDDIVVRALSDVVTEGEGAAEGEGEGTTEGTTEGSEEGTSDGEGQSTGGATLIFSEYIEGSSNNKALEIYNPTGSSVNLANYSVRLFSNGSSTPGNQLALSTIGASLAAGDTIVIANASADAAVLGAADTTSTVTFFNGDDTVALFDGSTLVDLIGEIGVDPGTNWTDGAHATNEQTLRRKISICTGNPDGFNPLSNLSGEWDTFAQNTFAGLGAHTVDCAAQPEGEGSVDGEGSADGEGTAEGEGTDEGEGEGQAVALCDEPGAIFCEEFEDNFDDPTDNANDDFQFLESVSVLSDGNNANWHIFTAVGNKFARINGFGADDQSDDWLITPAFNLNETTGEVFSFDSAYNF